MGHLERLCGAAVAVSLTAAGLAACSSGSSGTGGGSGATGGSGKASPKIAFVVGNANDAFYQKADQGARAEAAQLGIKLIDQGPNKFAPDAQIAVVQALLAQQPDALAIAPVDPSALNAPLNQWAVAKIPIVTFDGGLQNPPFRPASQISSQNTAGGQAAADEMARLLNNTGKVAVIDLNTSDKVLTDRKDGFIAELKAKHPGVDVVSTQLTGTDFGSAGTITETLLTKYPDLKGIFCTFELAQLPAAKALLDTHAASKVTLVGYEAGPQTISYLKQGVIEAVVAQQPAEEGKQAVLAAYNAATGKANSVQAQLKLPNVLITKDNVNTMQQYYYQVNK